ncbi:MAG: photosynthetic complex assembly protein PuhC [Burkholderiales bacterium]|nr:photosynthetic complex assembly protein PuhC [Burkholderiales bacterium]
MDDSAPARHPQWPIAAACALVLASIAAVAAVRVSGMPITPPDAAAVAESELRFVDRADGSIAVLDAASGRLIDNVVGESGFVRGTLRGLARERKRQGIGADQPFRLVARADGRLTLLDPATGRRVDLESFGPTNAAEFAHMLSAAEKQAALQPRN